MIPSDRARARDGRLAGLWILAPQGLRASPTRSIFVTLTFRVLTPMISTRHGRVQAPLGYRAARRATTTTGYRPVRAPRRHGVRAVRGRTGAVHDGPADADPGRPPGARQAMRKSRPPRAERQRRHGVRAPQGHAGVAHDGPARGAHLGPVERCGSPATPAPSAGDGTVRAPRGRTGAAHDSPTSHGMPSWTPSSDAEVPSDSDGSLPAHTRPPTPHTTARPAPSVWPVVDRHGRSPRVVAHAGGREPGPVTAVTCSGTRLARCQHSASRLRACRRARAP